MPKYGPEVAAMFMSRVGAELLIGSGQTFQVNDAARSDTKAGDGERWIYRSGANLIEQIFDGQNAAWRSHTLA